MLDLVGQLQAERESFSRSERRLVDIVLADVDKAVNGSIVELAGRAEISPPTVTRFCRRLGCSSFSEFKVRLAKSRILAERYSPRRLLREFGKRLPELVTRAPEMPALLHAWLEQQVEGRHELNMRSRDLAELARAVREAQVRIVAAILGVGALVAFAVLYALR